MIELYPHNQQAYENAKFVFETENKTAIVHATGTGKSLIIAKFIIDNPKAKCLFISPNNFIYQEIKKHIKGFSKNVDFTTYHYFLFNSVNSFVNYDYIFLDEFHRAGAEEWNKQIIELIIQNPNAKILGTSATHIRYLDNERNMTEELFNGNVSSYMTLGDAIEKKILEKPIYVSALYNINEIIEETKKRLVKHKKKKHLDNLKSKQVIWEKSNGIDFIINKYLTADRKKILVFCKSIEHIDFVKNLIIPIFDKFYDNNIQYSYVHTGIGNKNLNLKTFKNFSSSDIPQVLFSVDMLNEGIHVKGVDTIMMFRDTVSPIIYFQQMGRCFAVGQKLQPLIFDFVNNFNIKNSVGSIIQKFYNDFKISNNNEYYKKRNLIVDFYDETLEFQTFLESFIINSWDERFEELKTFVKTHDRLPKKEEMIWLSNQRNLFNSNKLSEDKIKKLKEINQNIFDLKVIRTVWEEELEKLKIFVKNNNRLPKNTEMIWLSYQKSAFKKGKLSANRINKLLSINKNIFEEIKIFKMWDERFEEFKTFVQNNNRLPYHEEMLWIRTQKALFKKGKLSEQQINKLLSIDKNIFKSKNIIKSWDERFEELKIFVKNNNRLPLLRESTWLFSQKEKFKNNKLTQFQIDKLLKIDKNIFDLRVLTWDERFEELKTFIKNNNRIPKTTEMGWLTKQRFDFHRNKLSQERVDRLLFIDKNILTNQYDNSWNERLEELKTFVQNNNRLPNTKEMNWLSTLKKNFKKNELTKEQIQNLKEIDKNIFK